LWGTRDPLAERKINLEMMTTCLSHGRPYRLPLRDDEVVKETRQFFFHSEEFRRLFPTQIVDWLEKHPRPEPSDEQSRQREAAFLKGGFYALPEPWDMPIVVAVRMSLSFPLLLSAVPLYAIDVTRVKEEDQKLERCWFSDGGISSDFPVHFFDSPLPRWPTFGISLTDKHPDHDVGVYLPTTNSGGNAERWIRFEWDPEKKAALPGATQLKGFVMAILTAMQNWTDNTQARLPGFRDRIARVSLAPNEGGLNLNMPPERIEQLARRGRDAGVQFVERFTKVHAEKALDWQNHRWVRLRAALAALEETLLRIDRSCHAPCNGDVPYDEWVRTADKSELPSYPWESLGNSEGWPYQRQKAAEMLALLRRCSQELQAGQAGPMPLNVGAPRPRAELRVRPRV
jgi:Patatin-like phospholipase